MSYQLTDIRTIKMLLRAHGKQLQKSLGQNFLVDSTVPYEIAQQANVSGCGVLEIGPGIGCLTVELGREAEKVVAVEIDQGLLPILDETLAGFSNVKVICGDIMKLDLPALLKEEFGDLPVRVCANLPYYITTPIVMKLLEERLPMESVTVMVQKEVAQRLCASPGGKEFGAVTLAVQYYSQPELLFSVPSQSFFPAPKVDSAVLTLHIRKEPPVSVSDEKKLFQLIKTAFSQRRKTLVNCLLSSGRYQLDKAGAEALLEGMGLSRTVRGEVLSLEQYAVLCETLETL